MSRLLSTGFEHGLAYGWPLGFDSLTNSGALSLVTSPVRHGSKAMKVTGSGTASFATKTVADQVLADRLYIYLLALPGGASAFVRAPGSLQAFQITVQTSGKLQAQIGASGGSNSATTLSTLTWYLIDYRFDASGSTYRLDYKISDASGSLLETATQLALGGQTAQAHTSLRVGQTGTTALSAVFDDCEADNDGTVYPLGPGASDDTVVGGITSFGPSPIDYPALIHPVGSILYGQLYPYAVNQKTQVPTQAQMAAAEAKAGRDINITHTVYNDVYAPNNLAVERGLMNGLMSGHKVEVIIEGLGFHSDTLGWPAGGFADIAAGALDDELDAWADLFDTLPETPFWFLLWKEMNANNTIYGPNGLANAGVNETPDTFKAGWDYVVDRWRTRNPFIRFIFGQGTSGTQTAAQRALYMPDLDKWDWGGCSSFVQLPSYAQALGQLRPWYDAFAPHHGAYCSTKPWIITGLGAAVADPARIVDTQAWATNFTTDFAPPTCPNAVTVWDSAPAGSFELIDTPTGYMAALQAMVNAAPFLGVADDFEWPSTDRSGELSLGVTT